MADHSESKKVIASCVYCPNPPDGEEHWLNRSLGKFAGNTYLTDRICTPCNVKFGGSIDVEFARTAHIGVTRQVLGIEGRSKHERKNPFDYKASQKEPPVQVFRVNDDGLTPVMEDAISRSPDGTLISIRARLLVIATPDGEHELRFPRGWGEHQLRSAAEANGLLGGRLVSAHVPPGETVDEFAAASRDAIRAVFGPFNIPVYTSRLDGPVEPIQPTLLRFNLSPGFVRGVAKIAFHYFLWACPQIGGDEPEFSGIRAYIRDGVGEPSDFIYKSDSLVDRIPAADGRGKDCHVLASASVAGDVIVQAHFFSQPVGPSFPTFVVKLGRRPDVVSADWRSMHVAAYADGVEGHDGTLRELSFAEPT